MEILIIGCGRVAADLAEILLQSGEAISVIAKDAEELLNIDHLDCSKTRGVPLDMRVLEKAGIKNVDAVLCISDNENINVTVGQMAHKIYGIGQVIVRIFNPENEAIYQALGLVTVCSTSMTTEKILGYLGFSQAADQTSVLGYPIRYDLRQVTESWHEVTVAEVEKKLKVHVLAVAEENSLKLVSRDYRFSEGEHVILVSLPEEG